MVTVRISPKAIRRVRRAKQAGAEMMFFDHRVVASDDSGRRMFCFARLGLRYFAILPDGLVSRLDGVPGWRKDADDCGEMARAARDES